MSYIQLLQSKFEADNGVDMNYTAFIQAIDKEYVGQVMERNKTLDERYGANHHHLEIGKYSGTS